MKCVFITGASGTGKTSYAKMIAKDQGYSVYVSSGSNDILDDYAGQDCIILDDLRPSCVGLSDLLKMLDNNTASTVKSRYRNKVLECKLIVITTTLPIDTFFKNVFKDDEESAIQLKRRCETHVELTMDEAIIRVWQKQSQRYGREFCVNNPVLIERDIVDMSEAEQAQMALKVLGKSAQTLLELVDDAKKNPKEYGFDLLEGQEKLPW